MNKTRLFMLSCMLLTVAGIVAVNGINKAISSGVAESSSEAEPAGENIFVTDFATQTWTAIDANNDGTTWETIDNRYAYKGTAAAGGADDYIVTPAISVKGGSNYKVTVRLKQSAAFEADQVEVCYGDAPDALTNSMGQGKVYETNGCGAVAGNFRISPAADGDIHIGVRVKGDNPNGMLALKDITVTTMAAASPKAVTNMKVVADPLSKIVKLTWTNPSQDTENIGIVQPISINIYENGTIVKTLSNREKGKKDSYTHTPATWSGTAEYRITAVIGDNESESVQQKIDLEDNTGELVLVQSFAQFTKDEFNANWHIENIVGTTTWKWGYKNTALFDYPTSKPQDDWLITPKAELQQGKRYIVKYKMQTSEKYSATIYVTVGNAQNSQAQTKVIQEHISLLQNGMRQFESQQFMVDADGGYYIGFHVTEAEVGVHLQAVEIYEVQIATGSGSGEGDDEDEDDQTVEEPCFQTDIDDDVCNVQFTTFDPASTPLLGTEGVDMMMAANYAMLDITTSTLLTEGYYMLTPEEGYIPNPSKTLHNTYVAGGACYHDGLVYSNEYDDEAQVDKQEPMWRIYDAKTFELQSETKLPDYCRATTNTLTYDAVEDKIYGFNYTYTETYLVRVDPQTGDMQRIGDFYDRNLKFLTIASRKDGSLFCIYMNKNTSVHYLARLRKSDGRLATIGTLACGGYMEEDDFVNGGYLQSMWFCNANDKLYWLYQSASNNVSGEDYTPIMEVDIETCSASLAAYMPRLYVSSGAFFVEPKFTAPAAVQSFDYIPTNDDHTQGYLEVLAPDKDYIGRPLTGNVTVVVLDVSDPDDITEMMSVETAPGTIARSENMTLNEGTINVQVYALNADEEEGVRLRRSFYAGYDLLKAPSNICLTSEELTTTLTWEAPTEGVNGHVVDLEGITYKVVRYPGKVTVANGLSECRFAETLPGDMTRYVYAVSSIDKAGVEGPSAYSNNLIVGTPLTIPFGGAFTTAADLFNYYTIIDRNSDNHTWTYDSNTNQAVYTYNELKSADDWLVSPPAIYEAGKHYQLTFTARSSMSDYPESFEVCWGDGRTPAECNMNLKTVDSVPTEETEYSIKLPEIEETGVYHFAIHCTTPVFHEYLYVNNIRVEATDDVSEPHVSRDEIVGDYIVMNYLSYEGSDLYIKDTRDFKIEADPESEDGVILTNFYVKQGDPFRAKYNTYNGSIVIPSGTHVFDFNDDTGSFQALYCWDEYSQNITSADIIFHEEDGGWVCSAYIVLMVGTSTEDFQPYNFAQRSVIRRANATTTSNSFIYEWNTTTGKLEIEEENEDKHASYIEFEGNSIRIYNLHPIDVYGYGCSLEVEYDEATGTVAAYPFICGEMSSSTDYPYKALAGTNLDEDDIPNGAYAAGTSKEGWITGILDAEAGKIVLNPVSIYPVAYDYETGELSIAYNSVYETIKNLTIRFDSGSLIDVIKELKSDGEHGSIVKAEYFNLAGQKVTAPRAGEVIVVRRTYSDGTTKTFTSVK